VKCDYDHTGTGVECEGVAAFTLHSHNRVRNICDPIAHRVWAQGKQPCYQCRRPKWKCWDVLPIPMEVTA
jgi:hypothetical protein